MKFLFDLLPVILFFVAFKVAGAHPEQAMSLAAGAIGGFTAAPIVAAQAPILLATLVAIVATVVQVGWLLARGRKVEPMLWIGLAVIVVFGGATIWLQDETFIKWKPTILYWAFALILSFGALVLKKNLVRALLGAAMQLPETIWSRLNTVWAIFFAAAGTLNLAVAYTTDTETWVNFKLFGLMGITLAFALGIGVWLSRHMQEASDVE
jgi:intracellular septation protein